jgi:hypothetical protein
MKLIKKDKNINLGFLESLNLEEFNSSLYPPLAAIYQKKLYLIDGVKRFKNAKYIIIKSEHELKNKLDQISTWLKINNQERKISEMEKAILISKTSEKLKTDDLISFFLPFFNLNIDLIKFYKKYMTLPKNIQKYIHIKNPPVNVVRYIIELPKDILKSLNKLILEFKQNPSTIRMLSEILIDLHIKHKKNYLEDSFFLDLFKNSGAKEAINFLRLERFNNLNSKIKKINKLRKEENLKLINIEFDKSFELPFIELKTRIKKEEDIEKLKKEITLLSKTKTIKEILKTYNE